MDVEAIDLNHSLQCHGLVMVVNASESREPYLQRQFTPADLAEFMADPSAFQAYGQLWRAPDGAVAGFGHLRNFYVNDMYICDLKFFVHPHYWDGDISQRIFGWAFQEAAALRQQEGRPVRLYADSLPSSQWRKQTLEAQGLTPFRYFYQMERLLDAPIAETTLPNGYQLRTFEPPRDLEAWVKLFNAAYAGQWNYTPTTEAIQAQLRDDPRYQSRYDLVIENAHGQLIAFCLGFVLERDGIRAGWVLELGVAPELRHQGLGRSLLLETIRRFEQNGLRSVRLAVDGANSSGAKRLYESLGFTTISSDVLYGVTLE